MEPGNLIKIERVKRGWSQEDLADKVGISQEAIFKIEKGTTKKSKFFPKISQVLDIPLAKLDASLSQYGDGTVNQPMEVSLKGQNPSLQIVPNEQLMGEHDLPVYSIVQGGGRALVLSSDPYTYTTRPKRLIGIANGYGVLVIGNSMAREYNENDIAYVDPHLYPKKGDPCVFQGEREDGTWEAVIKYLERSPDASDTLYYVSQTNPEKKFTLKKADWQKCHVAVGKESGR